MPEEVNRWRKKPPRRSSAMGISPKSGVLSLRKLYPRSEKPKREPRRRLRACVCAPQGKRPTRAQSDGGGDAMSHSPRTMAELLERITTWAEGNPDIRAAFLVGSQARTDVPADEWSDLDIPLIAVNPDHYLATTGWLNDLGEPWITFLEEM